MPTPRVTDPSQAPALAAIHAAAFPPGERWSAAAIAAMLTWPGVFGLLDPAGALILGRVAAGQAEILTLAVVPAIRRKGHAKTLLTTAETHAADAGAQAVFLEVAAANTGARALYAAAGYREIGHRRTYYQDGGNALVLRKDITRDGPTAA
jgi:ribosomal-protein-alanine N-acetyltransferase